MSWFHASAPAIALRSRLAEALQSMRAMLEVGRRLVPWTAALWLCGGCLDLLGHERRRHPDKRPRGDAAHRGRSDRGQAPAVRFHPHGDGVVPAVIRQLRDHHEQERGRHPAGHRPVRGRRDGAGQEAVSRADRGARDDLRDRRRRSDPVDGGRQRLAQAVQRRPLRRRGAGGRSREAPAVRRAGEPAHGAGRGGRDDTGGVRRRRRPGRRRPDPGRRHAHRRPRDRRPRPESGRRVPGRRGARPPDRLLHLVPRAGADLHARQVLAEPRRRRALPRARRDRADAWPGSGAARRLPARHLAVRRLDQPVPQLSDRRADSRTYQAPPPWLPRRRSRPRSRPAIRCASSASTCRSRSFPPRAARRSTSSKSGSATASRRDELSRRADRRRAVGRSGPGARRGIGLVRLPDLRAGNAALARAGRGEPEPAAHRRLQEEADRDLQVDPDPDPGDARQAAGRRRRAAISGSPAGAGRCLPAARGRAVPDLLPADRARLPLSAHVPPGGAGPDVPRGHGPCRRVGRSGTVRSRPSWIERIALLYGLALRRGRRGGDGADGGHDRPTSWRRSTSPRR